MKKRVTSLPLIMFIITAFTLSAALFFQMIAPAITPTLLTIASYSFLLFYIVQVVNIIQGLRIIGRTKRLCRECKAATPHTVLSIAYLIITVASGFDNFYVPFLDIFTRFHGVLSYLFFLLVNIFFGVLISALGRGRAFDPEML